MRKLLNKIFGIEYCVTVDFDGDVNISTIRKISSNPDILMTKRYGNLVWLYDDGTTSKSYIKNWKKILF